MKVGRALFAIWLLLTAAPLLGCQNIVIGRDSSDAATDRATATATATATAQSDPTNLDGPSNCREPTDAGGVVNCGSDFDCTAYVDYCRGGCGTCTPTTTISPSRSACPVPSVGSCRSACEGRMVVCAQGKCTVR